MRFRYFIAVLCVCTTCCFAYRHGATGEMVVPDDVKTYLELADRLGDRYQMRWNGFGGSGKGGKIYSINMDFYTYEKRKFSLEEARECLLNVLYDYLDLINDSKELRTHLCVYPFQPENLDISVFFSGDCEDEVYEPWVAVASCSRGQVRYSTYSPLKSYGYSSTTKETLREAHEKVGLLLNEMTSN